MSLLFIDGFDHYATADITRKGWTITGPSLSSSASIAAGTGRRGSGALKFTSSPDLHLNKSIPNSATVVMGAAYKAAASGNQDIWTVKDVSTQQVTLSVSSTGILQVYRGNGVVFSSTLLGQSTLAIPFNAFVYLEWKVTISPTVGAVEVRVNGDPWITLTNQNTRNSANSFANVVALGSHGQTSSGGNDFWFDDLYVCDTSGSANNTFLGDCRVDALHPSADGTYSAFAPSTGTAHWSLVDDPTLDGADYVSSSTVGVKDSYQFSDLTGNPAQVFGVQLANAVMKDDAGARQVANLVRSGGTDAQSAAAGVGTSLAYNLSVHETDPATGAAWTVSGVNAAQFGVVVAS